MSLKDKLEIGLKPDAPFRPDNLSEFQRDDEACRGRGATRRLARASSGTSRLRRAGREKTSSYAAASDRARSNESPPMSVVAAYNRTRCPHGLDTHSAASSWTPPLDG